MMKQMISYKISGNGDPILLIHGFGEDSSIWKHQVEFLQSNNKIIIPDLRGSGASAHFVAHNSIDLMAEDVLQILNHEQINSCIVLGHSMGGYIALSLMEKYPQRFNALGLIHSTAYADNEDKRQARLKSIEFIQHNTSFEFIKATIPNLFSETFKQKHPEQVEELIQQGRQFSKESLINYYKAMMSRPARTNVLKETLKPVLFFIGSEDKAVSPDDALHQSSFPKICKVEYVEHIAHMGMLESTSKLNNTLEEFLLFVQQVTTIKASDY